MTELTRESLDSDPIRQFNVWFAEASQISELDIASACCLSTIDQYGYPDARMVLLRGVENGGFLFYTNSFSTKGKALAALPRAAMTFYWGELDRQVRIQGDITVVEAGVADKYFAARPRPSQLSAWASKQSEELASRSELDQRVAEVEARFMGTVIPRPPHWNGYCLLPQRLEFWQERPHRLHDRFVYSRSSQGANWTLKRLYP